MPPLRILVVEDDPHDTELMLRELHRAGFENPEWLRVESEADYLDHLHADLDIILSDFQMPQFNGLRALELLKERGFDIPFILISGTIGEDIAVQAMKRGAADYLLKDRLARLGSAIQHALEESRLRRERESARETLQLRESALNEVSQGVIICDEKRLITYANTSFSRITGYSQGEVMGRNCALLQGVETSPETVQKIRSALRAGKAFEGEILNYRKDGEPFWNELSIAPIRGEEGGPLRFIGIQRDVTERKRAEEALQKSEAEIRKDRALLRTLIDSIPDLIFFKDENSRFLGFNKAFEEQFGFTEKILLGLTDYDIAPRDLAESYLIKDRELFASGQAQRTVDWIPFHAGGGGYFETVKTPYYGPDGASLGLVGVSRDITERNLADAALAASELRYHTLFENMVEGYAFCRLLYEGGKVSDFLYLEVNSAFESLSGLTNVVGKKISELVPDIRESSPELFEVYSRVALTGRTERFETYVPTMERWFSITVYSREKEHFIAVFDNITVRKQAEQHLEANEALLRQFIQHTPAAIAMLDLQMRYIQVSERWIQDYHLADRNIIGKSHYEIFPDAPAHWKGVHQRVLAGAVEHCEEDLFPRADGTTDWLEWEARPWHKAGGEIGGLIFFTQVITARKRAEIALRESQHFAESIAENSTSVIYVFDFKTRRNIYTNRIAAESLGYTSAQILDLGEDFLPKLMHPEDLPRVVRQSTRFAGMPDGHIFDTEVRLKHANGEWRWFWTRETVFNRNPDGTPRQIMGTAQDITERKQAEEKLAAALAQEKELSEKARAGDRAKGEFLAVMSHEVRTPMNGIIGFAELLLQAPLSPECHTYAQTIVQSGEALTQVLDDILDFSRMEAGRLKVATEIFSPRVLLEDIHRLMAHRAREKDVEVHLSVADSIPPHLKGDAGRLRQIVLNIVGNAIKFTQHGVIGITLKPLLDQPSTFVFAIKDTGVGITPGQIGRIFQPFTQADSSISRKYGGTGLGLTISRRLAELLGGELSVKSQPGVGSEFFVTLPLSIADEPREKPSSAPPEYLDTDFATKHPLRLLVVEDDRINLKLIQALLRRLGYAPLAAENGREAVQIFQQENPDCILMDLQMPEMDGIEATATIRSMEKSAGRNPAFISALTANIFPADRQRCFEAGMDAYLNKPVKLAAIAETLVQACASRGRSSEFVSPAA